MDPAPAPAIFVIELQDANKKLFCLLCPFEGVYIYIIFQRQKKSQNSRNQNFSYYFCLMIEGYGSGAVPLTNVSGSVLLPKKYGANGSGSATLAMDSPKWAQLPHVS
jgi:hypothetical protein